MKVGEVFRSYSHEKAGPEIPRYVTRGLGPEGSPERTGRTRLTAAAVATVTRSRAISRVTQVREIGSSVFAPAKATAPISSKAIAPTRAPANPAVRARTQSGRFPRPTAKASPARAPNEPQIRRA